MAVLTLWDHLFFAVREKIFWLNKLPFYISDQLKSIASFSLEQTLLQFQSFLPALPPLPCFFCTDRFFFLSVLDAGLLLPRGRALTVAGGLRAMGQHSV